MKVILINLAIRWLIGALRSNKKDIKEKAIDGLKKIPNEDLLEGITEFKK